EAHGAQGGAAPETRTCCARAPAAGRPRASRAPPAPFLRSRRIRGICLRFQRSAPPPPTSAVVHSSLTCTRPPKAKPEPRSSPLAPKAGRSCLGERALPCRMVLGVTPLGTEFLRF